MKKIVIVIILIILVVAIAVMAPPITSKSTTVISPTATGSPAPTPKASLAPLVKIDKNSDLSQEAKKLGVADYQSDFDNLDKTLSGF